MDKSQKKLEASSGISPYLKTGWLEMDRILDNFRRDFERSLSVFPAIDIPSLHTSIACDIADEGNRFVVNANMPGVHKDEVKLNVTENSIEISAEHEEEEHEKKK